ncbi:template-activating factor I [Trypanosoma grayi]|uniref:template-activating factor I n=1 Tax=Trypanosoma grayi TaxID=71804 RepID=UPI0004F428BC|nr:template-activating factor I [Trypanosoma grayi]KEG14636.1 template-activating factor I [Trypanosoma grayi]
MDSIPQNVIDAVSDCSNKVSALQAETDASLEKLRIEYRTKIEDLFEQRQGALDKVDGFWSGVLSATDSPLKPLLNGTIDPKILRAVTGFKVKTSVKDGSLRRSVSLELRPNMFAENGTILREVDTNLNTTALTPIQWKPGTERVRQDSLFKFFSPECNDEEFIDEALDAFDMVFQNPFLELESSED